MSLQQYDGVISLGQTGEDGMADVLNLEQRRLNMSRIRGRDTKPELSIRSGLHARGLRFRLHRKDLPGCPDLVFPCYGAVLFVHGCFWHQHDCPMFKVPASRSEFWITKLGGNQTRDARARVDLAAAGWRTLVVWECALRGPSRRSVDSVLDDIVAWLNTGEPEAVIQGGWNTIARS